MTNIMFGADFLTIDRSCKELISALNNTPYDDKGVRLDDKSTNIDSLDSMEYGFITELKPIRDRLLRNAVVHKQKERMGSIINE